jgi:hypothetical protein
MVAEADRTRYNSSSAGVITRFVNLVDQQTPLRFGKELRS